MFGGVEGHVELHSDARLRKAFWYPLLLLDFPLSLVADVVFLPATLASDVSWEHATDVALDEEHLIIVHARLLDLPAAHTSFVIKKGGEWKTVEVSKVSQPSTSRAGAGVYRKSEVKIHPGASSLGQHRIIGVLTGEEARQGIAVLERLTEEYRSGDGDEAHSRNAYRAWPGPNSNTFVDRTSRSLPHLAFEPHHLAVGKDYTPYVRVGRTSTKTGVEFETALVGVQVGLREGFEVHVLQLTLGFSLWPPALKVPFQERLGFSKRWVVDVGRRGLPSGDFPWKKRRR